MVRSMVSKDMWLRRALLTLLALVALMVVVLLALSSGPAEAATTFTVNNTGDASDRRISDTVCDSSRLSGNQCTLRAAIEESNDTSGADRINFNIGGTAGVKTINVGSTGLEALPSITEAVIINGYTQPGASANTRRVGNDAVLKVQLNGNNAGKFANGLVITASNSTIKGLVMNRFEGSGVHITGAGATDNRVEGNFMGTNASGTQALANLVNGDNGVEIFDAPSNTIGGTEPAQRNVISGNVNHGVRIVDSGVTLPGATGNEVEGNYIGTKADGTEALGNTGSGVVISNAPGNTVGRTVAGARNVISGNDSEGVLIIGPEATGNEVEGNFIGTNAKGTAGLGNTNGGVFILDAPSNTIGGTDADDGAVDGVVKARNVISGGDSVRIEGPEATGNEVEGNFIGTNALGTETLNDFQNAHGVLILDAPSNTIGGTEPGARNVISGNGDEDVRIAAAGATGNEVEGNYIGTKADGSGDLGINGGGVFIGNASNNTIGGTDAADGAVDGVVKAANVISGSRFDGVQIEGSGATGNSVLSNRIFSNGELGIDLLGGAQDANGVTANDVDPNGPNDDSDTGANRLQNFPLIGRATKVGSTLTVPGTLNSTPLQSFTIQCFLATSDPSGHGEGRTLVGETTATTDANGHATFSGETSCTGTVVLIPGQTVTVTATATNTITGDTSEFSANKVVQ